MVASNNFDQAVRLAQMIPRFSNDYKTALIKIMSINNTINNKLERPIRASSKSEPMTDDMAISIRHLSKMYPLYANPQDRLKQSLWHTLPSFLRGESREFYKEFWALRNLSFEIKKGETVGIIGRNGSGKSTLLQIIAGILAPTQGEVQINGRVAALLELGSGFNPEFTGRENVYLNGSIWGLTQEEINNIFEDIAAFADIGQFINQSVKLYSSGMYVRLAFAVQTFVPKEIFIVDEALSVGDEAFQRKCMAKLEEFRENGGTVLLVSHDTQTIVRHCERCLLLNHGKLIADGNSKPVTDLYQKLMYCPPESELDIITILREHGLQYALNHALTVNKISSSPPSQTQDKDSLLNVDLAEHTNSNNQPSSDKSTPTDWFDPHLPQPNQVDYGNGHAEIFDYGMYNGNGDKVNILITGRRYDWTYWVRFYHDAYRVNFGMMLKTIDGLDVAGIASNRERVFFDRIAAGSEFKITFSLQMNVVPGAYFLNCGIDGYIDHQIAYLHRQVDIAMVRVIPGDARTPYGVAYLHPQFKYEVLSHAGPE